MCINLWTQWRRGDSKGISGYSQGFREQSEAIVEWGGKYSRLSRTQRGRRNFISYYFFVFEIHARDVDDASQLESAIAIRTCKTCGVFTGMQHLVGNKGETDTTL